MKIEVNKIMNPAFLLGTAFNIAYWHRNQEMTNRWRHSLWLRIYPVKISSKEISLSSLLILKFVVAHLLSCLFLCLPATGRAERLWTGIIIKEKH